MKKVNDRNLLLLTDYYKHTHHMQYPPGTKTIHSYIESRGGLFDEVKFFGLQAFIKEYIEGIAFTQSDIDEAEAFLNAGFNKPYFNKAGWQSLLDKHGGMLPLCITAVKEGSINAVRKTLVTIHNTDHEEFGWLTQFIETALLRAIWYPTTVCTLSYKMKQKIQEYATKQGTTVTPFHLNDFSARGVSSHETASLGGMAHLVNFMGTDTIEGIQAANKYYNSGVCGFSVFATEHSTTTIWGEENECAAYEHFINNAPDDAIISIVIDSYDTANAVKNLLGGTLKEKILSRSGKTVFRPDSGCPINMSVMVTEALWEIFGGTERISNGRLYKVLNPKVGVIYGDGINYDSIGEILRALDVRHFPIDGIVFGCGGALGQQVHRDTQKFACKATMAYIDETNIQMQELNRTGWVQIKKKSNQADKASFAGVPTKLKDGTIVPNLPGIEDHEVIFRDGKLLKEYTFTEVRGW